MLIKMCHHVLQIFIIRINDNYDYHYRKLIALETKAIPFAVTFDILYFLCKPLGNSLDYEYI